MIIYIAGKITGDPDYRAKFSAAASALEADGHTVINPALLPAGLADDAYMRICLAMIDAADEVDLLPYWERSQGAKLERDYARRIGKLVRELLKTPEQEEADAEARYWDDYASDDGYY